MRVDIHHTSSVSEDNQDLSREFERLYLDSYSLVYNYVRYRMDNADAAEDVVAEAFLLAARAFRTFDPTRAKFSTWVTSIATNCMNSYYRKAKTTYNIEDVSEARMAVSGEQAEIEERAYVDYLLSVLSPEERELVVMKYREGKRNTDISQELGMNASTVATKLSKALAKMRVVAERG